jgi:hypothetical protein
MAKWNAIDYPVEQIRSWIAEGKTHAWIGAYLCVNPKLIYKVCKKHGIKCQRTGPRSGEGHPDWNGGRIYDKHGYVYLYTPNHPFGRKSRGTYVLEHRLVMERKLGRYLLPEEVVHHINGKHDDNRPENLQLFAKNSDHLKHELTGKCPNWTTEGRRRTLEGNLKWRRSRKVSKPSDSTKPQTTDHSTT